MRNQQRSLANALCLALRSRSVGLAGDCFSLGQSYLDSGRLEGASSGTAVALMSFTTLQHGVRQDNWSEGRFRCRWPRENSKSGRFKHGHPL